MNWRHSILFVLMILSLSFAPYTYASSKIWEGVIVKVQGKTIFYKPQYTPYASASLYPKFCDTADKEGELLRITLAEGVGKGEQVHVPCIDDVPVLPEDFIAAAKPGMRIIGFMNRKQWHYVSLVVRDAQVEVGYFQGLEEGQLIMRRPQANWPAQMSNRETFSAKQFPDRIFKVPFPNNAIGIKGGKQVAAKSLLQNNQPLMAIPAANMRVEWIPNPAERWDPNIEPLKGNYGEYEHRKNPKFNVMFYQGGVTGTLLEEKSVKREVANRPPSTSSKPYDTWKIFVPYGPLQGEYILPSRGHKTQLIVAGHFNTFPSFDYMKTGRRVTAWAYRTQRAPNWLFFDAQDMKAEGVIESIDGHQVTLSVPSPKGNQQITIKLDEDATYHRLGLEISKSEALSVGNTLRVYPARPATLVAGNK